MPAAKWAWFKSQVEAGSMVAMDPKTGLPDRWSLAPVDTLGMVFWTRNPKNLICDVDLLKPYRKVIHVTLTGWTEVEHRAPDIEEGLALLANTVEAFGVDNVTWRFSPVPLVADVDVRFERIARVVGALGIRRVYVSFLQQNDLVPETRAAAERRDLLFRLSRLTELQIVLCNDDLETLKDSNDGQVQNGVCESGVRFGRNLRIEQCGCALGVDPFSRNEACVYGCQYCYAGNQDTSPKKRNTTRLPIYR